MNKEYPQIIKAQAKLSREYDDLVNKDQILKSINFKSLFDEIKLLPAKDRKEYGSQVNKLKEYYQKLLINDLSIGSQNLNEIDVSSSLDINQNIDSLRLLPQPQGSIHPLMKEMELILNIFYEMGFNAIESLEIDDDYHMFSSLNFPEGHPARDDFDTFSLIQKDHSGKNLIAPAHTSAMQNRVLRKFKNNLENNKPIATVIPGRVFRREDVDARHEHTFFQLEGVYVAKNVSVANLMATLDLFMTSYFDSTLEFKSQPFYFPFTEPSFELAASCPYCKKAGCSVCSYSGWIEVLGCGMIHPHVLRMANIDPEIYTGFAFGIGFMRLTMIKYGIEDIRNFFGSKLNFLEQFK